MAKQIRFGTAARDQILVGANILADAVIFILEPASGEGQKWLGFLR